MAPVRRKLDFGETNDEKYDCINFLKCEVQNAYSDAKLVWNFDFVEGVPLPNGRFEWVPVTPEEVPSAYNNLHPGKNTLVTSVEGMNIGEANLVQRNKTIISTRKKLTQRLLTSMLAIKKSVSSKTKSAGRDSLSKLRRSISKSEPVSADKWRISGPSTSVSASTRS